VAWAAWAGVEVVDVGSWPEFWDAVDAHLPAPSALALLDAWKFVCNEAKRYSGREDSEEKAVH
jgi:hypothetical protein